MLARSRSVVAAGRWLRIWESAPLLSLSFSLFPTVGSESDLLLLRTVGVRGIGCWSKKDSVHLDGFYCLHFAQPPPDRPPHILSLDPRPRRRHVFGCDSILSTNATR